MLKPEISVLTNKQVEDSRPGVEIDLGIDINIHQNTNNYYLKSIVEVRHFLSN